VGQTAECIVVAKCKFVGTNCVRQANWQNWINKKEILCKEHSIQQDLIWIIKIKIKNTSYFLLWPTVQKTDKMIRGREESRKFAILNLWQIPKRWITSLKNSKLILWILGKIFFQ
jgi:hypothetical protein